MIIVRNASFWKQACAMVDVEGVPWGSMEPFIWRAAFENNMCKRTTYTTLSLPSSMGEVRKAREVLVNNLTPLWIHSCIPAISVDEEKRVCQAGVSRKIFLCECVV